MKKGRWLVMDETVGKLGASGSSIYGTKQGRGNRIYQDALLGGIGHGAARPSSHHEESCSSVHMQSANRPYPIGSKLVLVKGFEPWKRFKRCIDVLTIIPCSHNIWSGLQVNFGVARFGSSLAPNSKIHWEQILTLSGIFGLRSYPILELYTLALSQDKIVN